MKQPNFIQSKIDVFKPEYHNLKFENQTHFVAWLVETSKTAIVLEDSGQDLLKLYVAESSEIIHTELPFLANIYNGALLLDDTELLLPGDTIAIWIPQFNEVSSLKYKVKKVLRK